MQFFIDDISLASAVYFLNEKTQSLEYMRWYKACEGREFQPNRLYPVRLDGGVTIGQTISSAMYIKTEFDWSLH